MSDDRQRVGLTEGTVVDGRYRIESELGRGGFARVYRAAHTDLERGAALKVIELPERPGAVDLFIERFLREARIAANLSHPNVVTVYDYGVVEQTGQPYLAMELLDGWDLEMVLSHHGPMKPARAIKLMIEVLDALAEAQDKGIVHKDLKPSNLFMVGEGTLRERLVLIDFGIARIWDDDNSRITQTGGFTGTPAYFAPEYVEHQIVTPAIDVYQCALILVEMMTSIPAVIAENSMQYLLKHCSGDVEIPTELRDSPLGAVLDEALATNHEERFPDCAAFRDALAAIDSAAVPQPSRSRGGPVVRHNTLETAPQTDEFADSIASGDTLAAPNNLRSAPTSAETTPETPSAIADQIAVATAPRRTPLIWVVAVAAIVALIGGAAILRRESPPPTPAPTATTQEQQRAIAPADEAEAEPPEVAPPEPIEEAVQPITVTTRPPGAMLTIGGTHYGATPVRLGETLLDGASHEIVLSKDGFEPLQTEVVLEPGADLAFALKRIKKRRSAKRNPLKRLKKRAEQHQKATNPAVVAP